VPIPSEQLLWKMRDTAQGYTYRASSYI